MKLRNLAALVLFAQLFVLASGCAILKGQDPIVVNAERTTAIALDVFDTFLHYEYDNREALAKISPDIHKVAETIRRHGKEWLITARNLTKAYKENRSDQNKFQLVTAISVLQSAMSESTKYLAVKTVNSNP
jgi:hypothetical protein